MIDNRTASAIDLALQKHDTPVGPLFVAQLHGRMKKCFSRSGAISRLAHFMVQHVFDKHKIPTHQGGGEKEIAGIVLFSRGELTMNYLKAHYRAERRIRHILARKREMKKWCEKWERMHDRYIKERDELQATKPEGIR